MPKGLQTVRKCKGYKVQLHLKITHKETANSFKHAKQQLYRGKTMNNALKLKSHIYLPTKAKRYPSPCLKTFLRAFIIACILILNASSVFAFSDSQLADAIYKAEHSKTHPYGILKHYKHTTPRQACLNTIAHARQDWNEEGDFVSFLGSRYCPVNCENDNGTNKFWISNVRYFLCSN